MTGAELKAQALALHETHREDFLLLARRALLERALQAGQATADDVRRVVELPEGVGPDLFGAVPGPLARQGIIKRTGYVPSTRPERHAAPVAVWTLLDSGKAVDWLEDHAAPEVVE